MKNEIIEVMLEHLERMAIRNNKGWYSRGGGGKEPSLDQLDLSMDLKNLRSNIEQLRNRINTED